MRQAIYAGQAVVDGIVAFASSGRKAIQTLHLLLECWKSFSLESSLQVTQSTCNFMAKVAKETVFRVDLCLCL